MLFVGVHVLQTLSFLKPLHALFFWKFCDLGAFGLYHVSLFHILNSVIEKKYDYRRSFC